jgi:CubicO group peptidase (beta-lactamase class C family)
MWRSLGVRAAPHAPAMSALVACLAWAALRDAAPLAAQPAQGATPSVEVVRLGLAGPAKRYCSGIWVSEREPEEALGNSVLLSNADVRDHDAGLVRFEVDRARRIVTAHRGEVSARARHFGDQGCVILPPGSDEVFFTPRRVESKLPDARTTPWPMGDRLPEGPLPAGVDGRLLEQAVATFYSNPEDRRAAFLVVHRGRIVAERYGSGAHVGMQLESWSMGKSMTATFIGRLIQMGHFGLWDPAPVPEWRNSPGDPRAAIRIADLLRMSSGLQFTGSGAPAAELTRSAVPGWADHLLGYAAPIDIFRFSASRPLEHPPNTVGRYRNSDPWTLGYVVRRTVESLGEEYLSWPQRDLFDRIGIRRFVMETDLYGNFILTGYNFGTARDWARLGLLYLQRGVWNGERLLPEEFVDFVRAPAPAWSPPQYGGLFWINGGDPSRREISGLPADAYWAAGAGNQYTFIVPSRDLVVVVMSHRRGESVSRDADERMNEALGLVVKAVDPSWSW